MQVVEIELKMRNQQNYYQVDERCRTIACTLSHVQSATRLYKNKIEQVFGTVDGEFLYQIRYDVSLWF